MSKKNSDLKTMKVSIKNNDATQVKVQFTGGVCSPEEFTSLIMALIETYTEGLIEKNSNAEVYDHWNKVFGIFLNKLLPPEEIYERDENHKKLKEVADSTLGRPETKEDRKATEENRLAAYLLAREILIKDAGLDETSVDVLLNKRLGTLKKVN